jgi:hypothetical protein
MSDNNLNIHTIIYNLVNLRQINKTISQYCEELETLVSQFSDHYSFIDTEHFLYNQFQIGVNQYYKEAIDELFIENYADCKYYCIQLEQNLLDNNYEL